MMENIWFALRASEGMDFYDQAMLTVGFLFAAR